MSKRLYDTIHYIIDKSKVDDFEYIESMIDTFFPDIYYTNELINNKKNYVKNNIKKYFETVEEFDDFYENHADTIKLSPESLILWNKYKKIRAIPQPVQKSPEWFIARNKLISASDGAKALGEDKYNTKESLILGKIGHGEKFTENKFVYHGKKYEKIAIMIYENMLNVKIGEFGLINHPTIPFLGASPDGICTCTDLDGNESKLVGRMLEIKCPVTRKIKTSGEEDNEICPHGYWVQVQQQLECCDLEECDFWQCNIIEYNSFDDMELFNQENYTIQQNEIFEFDDIFKRGMIIQLLPIDFIVPDGEKIEWYCRYIYPPTLNMTINDYNAWGKYTMDTYKDKDYKVDKILYWRLENSHNYLIKRNKEWFESNLNRFKEFWDQVVFLRNNEEELNNFVKKYKKVKKEKKSYGDSSFEKSAFIDD